MTQLPKALSLIFALQMCAGCGYTVLRDYREEERQAELAAIDSLSVAPDLTISNIEYSYISPPGRRSALDDIALPPKLQVHLLVLNIGNADIVEPYYIAYTVEHQRSFVKHRYWKRCNERRDTIRAHSGEEVELLTTWPHEGAVCTFTIVTNPKVQHDVERVDEYFDPEYKGRQANRPIRESRYDNNTATITVDKSALLRPGEWYTQ